jgi:hypothetical protein
MELLMRRLISVVVLCVLQLPVRVDATDLLTIEDAAVRVGIDRKKGGAITWLSTQSYQQNMVNIADPGRLIQQSYYAGRRVDRRADGQHRSWSPWSWNPIQGGGVGAGGDAGTWSRVTKFQRTENSLHSECVPKLWDMADEEAEAVMRQWTSLEQGVPGVIRVRCEFESLRQEGDRWGEARNSPQELPACYFTRNFSDVRSYLGNSRWRAEHQQPGPPWGQAQPPLRAMALFEAQGNGVAVFSPACRGHWNFGPHGTGNTDMPTAGPCMHVAPVDRVPMGHRSILRYRYWIVTGDEALVAECLDALWEQYSDEELQIINPSR